jgi:hypothetical protein
MRLMLAMSCLQGRPMGSAFAELLALAPDGVQLTPGNAPTVGFAAVARGAPTRTHHGFSFAAMRAPVWADGALQGAWDSVHPPKGGREDWAPPEGLETAIEIMYPGEPLGDGASVARAMDAGVALAVDVSHVFIQRTQGAMSGAVWRRLQDYPRVAEIHVSANDGARDRHAPLAPDTFGLDWARARGADGPPLILESYFHKLTEDERRRQLAIVRGP